MPAALKSKAQMERFKRMVSEGVISQTEFDASLKLTGDIEKLPERLHPKKEKKVTATDEVA